MIYYFYNNNNNNNSNSNSNSNSNNSNNNNNHKNNNNNNNNIKVSPRLKGLSEQLGQPKANQLPAWLSQQAISLQSQLSGLQDNAEKVVSDPSKSLLCTEMKAIAEIANKASRVEALVKQMITTFNNL